MFHCLWPSHWAPLERAWLHLLYILLSGIYIGTISTEPSPAWTRLDWQLLPSLYSKSALVKGKPCLDVFAHERKEHSSSMNKTCLLRHQSSNTIDMLKPDISTVFFGEMFSLVFIRWGSPSKNIAISAPGGVSVVGRVWGFGFLGFCVCVCAVSTS